MPIPYTELTKLAFSALKERKVRSILTTMMVVIGVTLITALNGFLAGTEARVTEQFSTLGANVIWVYSTSSAMVLTPSVANNIKAISGVQEVVPIVMQSATVTIGGTEKSVVILGIDQSKLNLIFPTAEVEEGTYVPYTSSYGALLGSSVAKVEGRKAVSVGQTITIKYLKLEGGRSIPQQKTLRVEGILAPAGAGGFFSIDNMILVSTPAAQSMFSKGNSYDSILVVAKNEDVVSDVAKKIKEAYPQVEALTWKGLLNAIKTIVGTLQAMGNAIASVSLMVAAVGILASLYTSVVERTREIGLLKALGFTSRDVAMQFLFEATLIGVIGGAIGNVLGVGLAYLLAYIVAQYRETALGAWQEASTEMNTYGSPISPYTPPIFTPWIFVSAWMFAVIVSALAGVYPAMRAAKLDPVEALRRE